MPKVGSVPISLDRFESESGDGLRSLGGGEYSGIGAKVTCFFKIDLSGLGDGSGAGLGVGLAGLGTGVVTGLGPRSGASVGLLESASSLSRCGLGA